MKLFRFLPALIAACTLVLSPTIGLALTSQYEDKYVETSKYCGFFDRTSAFGDREECLDATILLLSSVSGSTADEQFDYEVGTYALITLEYYLDFPAPHPSICILFADVLLEISKVATDLDQAERIFDLSEIVRGCGRFGFNANRLLASPN